MDDTTFAEMDLLRADAQGLENQATDKNAKLDHHKLVNTLLFAVDAGYVLQVIRIEASRVLEGKPPDAITTMTKIVELIDAMLKGRGNPSHE